MAPSTALAYSSPVSSGIGSASMSPRSRTVGPGRVAVEHGDDRAGRRARRDRQRQPVERLEHGRLGRRQLEPELGVAVDPAPQLDGVVELGTGGIEQAVETGRS